LTETHPWNLERSSQLSRLQVDNPIAVHEVIRVLNRAKVSFVLVGAYGIAGWLKKPRATEVVDVVVAARQVKKAVRELVAAFPELDPEEHEVVVRLRQRSTKMVAIDVMKPVQPPYMEIFKHTKKTTSGKESYRIPTLEMALACKFAPLVSLTRSETDKQRDAFDFRQMIDANPDIDLDVLEAIGERIFPGGGKELVEKVGQVRAGKRLTF
ncbi:MAG TPA: hypothetical protein VHR72_03395, partial [Gemmataceae bacterium]|nr:hypothetical protein [Gemmataceae bacterium]